MKLFDATSVIAFLGELAFPDGLRLLSTRHELIVPSRVAGEVQREPARTSLETLVKEGCVRIEAVTPTLVEEYRALHPQLGIGECELLALVGLRGNPPDTYLVSDDSKARVKFPQFTFVWTEALIDYMRARGLIGDTQHSDLLNQLASSTFYSRVRKDGIGPRGEQPL